MNERIRALAEQARIKDHWSIDEGRYLTNYLNEQKFADLIVNRCIEIVESIEPGYEDYRNQIEDAFRRDCVTEIKYDFGVEE